MTTSSSLRAVGRPRQERLPPHSRRHKVPASNRQRVVCACNPCNVRRIKCTGERPCKACTRNSRECIYPTVTERVYVSRGELEALKTECSVLRRCLEESVPSDSQRDALIRKWSDAMSESPYMGTTPDDDPHEHDYQDLPQGRVLRYSDDYARFHGASAGAVFIDQLRGLSRSLDPDVLPESSFGSALGRVHTYDSRPILMSGVDPLESPPIEQIAGLLGAFFGYTEDRNDPYGCGGIYYWGNLRDILSHAAGAAKQTAKGLCLLNATLALACQFDCFPAQRGENNPGETFFSRATQLLGNPLSQSTITDMKALTFMSYYLLGTGRRDTAYVYICAAMRIAIVNGLHEGWVANERERREFWNIFILDRWLSCLTGRQPSITNESLTLGLPETPVGKDEDDLPLPDGLRAHVELALIMGDVTSKIYGAHCLKQGLPALVFHINDCLLKLTEWSDALPSSLRLTLSPSAENPNKIILHLIYNQLVLLCTRPLLFIAVKQRLTYHFVDTTRMKVPDSLVAKCINAARHNAELISGLMDSRPAVMMLTLRYHYSFNAAVVLELALTLPQHARAEDTQLIERLLDDLRNPGQSENECSMDCAKMVAEFYAVVEQFRHLTFVSSDSPDSSSGSERLGEAKYNSDDRATTSRVLSAVELSTKYLPEITLCPDDPNRSSEWQAKKVRELNH